MHSKHFVSEVWPKISNSCISRNRTIQRLCLNRFSSKQNIGRCGFSFLSIPDNQKLKANMNILCRWVWQRMLEVFAQQWRTYMIALALFLCFCLSINLCIHKNIVINICIGSGKTADASQFCIHVKHFVERWMWSIRDLIQCLNWV